MTTVRINAEFICVFQTFQQWVNHAQSWIGGYTNRDKIVCVDQDNNVCNIGADFAMSRDLQKFPVLVYRLLPSNPAYPPHNPGPRAGKGDNTMKPATLKKFWVVRLANGAAAYWSIAPTKNRSLALFLEGSGMPGDKAYWTRAKKRGHRLAQVNIIFEPVIPKKTSSNPTDWYADPGKSGKVDL